MTRFLQVHALTFYPPSNLNRDDSGRPKTCVVGGKERLRISSQCLKRAWRMSDSFHEAMAKHCGTRSQKVVHQHFYEKLLEGGIKEKTALEWAETVALTFGAVDKKKKEKGVIATSQLVHFSPGEIEALEKLADVLAKEDRKPTEEELKGLKGSGRAVDIAMFGRMLADTPEDNVDAAVQVAHAFTVNQVTMEEDFFTAVDDLNTREDSGAGHLGESWFGSGVYYIYICIDTELLKKNLGGDQALAQQAVRALVEALCTVSPSGKQNSFAALSPAAYVLVEPTDRAPRSLALSFLKPVGSDYVTKAVAELEETRKKLATAYGHDLSNCYRFSPLSGEGTFADLLQFTTEALP